MSKHAQRRDEVPTCAVTCVDVAATGRARAAMPPAVAINALAETLGALGDSTRLRIVAALGTPGVKELCVCDLASLVGVSQSAVSHSLRVLRDLRLVQARRVGKIAFYTLDDVHVGDLLRIGFAHVDEQAGSSSVRRR